MQPQHYLLTLMTLFALLTPRHGVSAALNSPELSSRGETKIVQAASLFLAEKSAEDASSGQGELVAQARGDDSGKAEALSTIVRIAIFF
jgi:hypothetical protein